MGRLERVLSNDGRFAGVADVDLRPVAELSGEHAFVVFGGDGEWGAGRGADADAVALLKDGVPVVIAEESTDMT
ncbi:hypothetical protein [Nocardia gipuzkoensis]|uniref:hypothetical protein n=1 Tax=Nocardia gipuzkoensis TaxID=2749991 RepID=UPI00237E88FA|nr:hypothetical protein [Nocardia gipuzkoensis]MDE1675278.1 hypothetical protein [Nocardia gipuzkoensis]